MSLAQILEAPALAAQPGIAEMKRPVRFWLGMGLWLAFVAVAMAWIDRPVSLWFGYTKVGQSLEGFFTFCAFMGLYSIQLLILIIFLALPVRKKLMIGYYAPALTSLVICTALKLIAGRARPQAMMGAHRFEWFHGNSHLMESFPSGEATTSMMLATLLGIYFPRMKWAFWLLAFWDAMGRVSKPVHFVSDVTFGAGIGFLCVYFWVKRLGLAYYPNISGCDPKRLGG